MKKQTFVWEGSENMDPDFDAHFHKIDSTNYIEYQAPHPSKVKYTPPSPTTSGYSESGSEMDNHDSGRVSEMEGSPKMFPKRPNAIPLTTTVFNVGEGPMTSPDPFPEGKTTIKNNAARCSSTDDASQPSEPDNSVTVNVRTLVHFLREAHSRLDDLEGKVDTLVKALQLQNNNSNVALTKLSRAVLSLRGDFRSCAAASCGSQNGRIPAKFQPLVHDPVRRFQVPVSCNNNNVSRSYDSEKFQSYDLLHSSSLPRATSTFPRFLRTDAFSSLSVAPPRDKELESYDNVLSGHKSPEIQRPKSEYVNDDVSRAQVNDSRQKSPVYAVVKKKKKSSNESEDQPPALPRRSLEMLTSLTDDAEGSGNEQPLSRSSLGVMTSPSNDGENIQKGPSEDELEEMIRESIVCESLKLGPSRDGSPRRSSRFLELESALPIFGSSDAFTEGNSLSVEVSNFGTDDYEKTLASGLPVSQSDGFVEEDVFALEPVRKDGSADRSLNELTHAGTPDEEKREIATRVTDASWRAPKHGTTYSNAPTVKRSVSEARPRDRKQANSVGRASSVTKSLSSLNTESSDSKGGKRGRRKQRSSDSKKENVFVSNYNKLFRRKGKKKRTESQDSFTFITSPLYEAEIANVSTSKGSPNGFRRGISVDSALSGKKSRAPTVSTISNLSSSQEGSVFVARSQGDINAPSDARRSSRSLTSLQSPANTQLLRLQSDREASGEFDNVESESEKYDNVKAEAMRPSLIKLAKKAFRNSPKIRKKGKTSGNGQTAELKPKLPNGHAVKRDPLPPIPPEKEIKPITPTENSPVFVKYTADSSVADDVFIPPGEIHERLQREQADRIRFESDRSGAPDEPPPKPNRPGFSRGDQGSPRSSSNSQSNGGVPGYPRGTPALPTKQKIMTPEELTNFEAEERLRRKQEEQNRIQQTLAQQKKQAAADKLWLEKEEQDLFTSLQSPEAAANGGDGALSRGRGSSNSIADMHGTMEAPPPPSVAPSKPPRKTSRPKEEPAGPPQTKLEEVKTAPTMQLNRDDDDVYKDTMEVVKAVLGMNNMTMEAKPDELYASVKTVGAALKQLCASLEKTLPELPEDFHREIDMAQRTTNKDLSQVINQLKLVQRFYNTTQVVDYKKCLMAANQVLAIDAKNLLDVVDRARIRKIQTAQEKAKAQANDIRAGVTQAAPADYEPEDLYPDGDFL